MNLNQIIANAAAGFAVGLAASEFRRKLDKVEYEIEVVNSTMPEDELKKTEAGRSIPEVLEKIRKHKRRLLVMPVVAGYWAAFASDILSMHSLPTYENAVVAIPSAIAGYYTGIGLKHLKTRKEKAELKIAQEIKTNPDKVEYYIARETKERIDESLSAIEKLITEGEELDLSKVDGEIEKMNCELKKDRKTYTPFVVQWIKNKLAGTIRLAKAQKSLKEFYETEVSIPGIKSCLFGEYRGLNTVVFSREGDKFYVKEYAWPGFNFLEIDDSKLPITISPTGETTYRLIEESHWNGDYRGLAKRITQEQRSCLLLSSPVPNVPRPLEESIIGSIIAQEAKSKVS